MRQAVLKEEMAEGKGIFISVLPNLEMGALAASINKMKKAGFRGADALTRCGVPFGVPEPLPPFPPVGRLGGALRGRLIGSRLVLHPSMPLLVVAAVFVAEYSGAERLGARKRVRRVVAVDICGDQPVGQ